MTYNYFRRMPRLTCYPLHSMPQPQITRKIICCPQFFYQQSSQAIFSFTSGTSRIKPVVQNYLEIVWQMHFVRMAFEVLLPAMISLLRSLQKSHILSRQQVFSCQGCLVLNLFHLLLKTPHIFFLKNPQKFINLPVDIGLLLFRAQTLSTFA